MRISWIGAGEVPFLVSIVLVVVGLYIRGRLAESPQFQKIKDLKQEVKMPIIESIKKYPKEILLAMGARFAENGFFYIYAVFVMMYATQALGMPRQSILNGVMIAAFIEVFTIPAFGLLSDKIGRRPVYIFGAVFSAVMSFPLFYLMNTKVAYLGWIGIVLGLGVGHAAMYGPQAKASSPRCWYEDPLQRVSLGYNTGPHLCRRPFPAYRHLASHHVQARDVAHLGLYDLSGSDHGRVSVFRR